MKLSQGVEWSVHCAVLLAQGPPGTVASRRTLAGFYGLPEAYLAKHLKSLVRSGVLHATSGPRGGFRLARPAAEITVLDVVEAVEGEASAFVCTEIRQRGVCAIPAEQCVRRCTVDRIMQDADDAWRESLRGRTIGEIARGLSPEVRERSRGYLAENRPA
ncbi:transcriptional regulator [Mangrovactinospora gilvigrisea]|uniref:Transcriptional regulator n=1 Tax=Mangrovactinospora gilvigrisea TaxID=1428644 RepID=A0A1J7BYC4_9ACTN|nr:Rrf2 family transcriptional regulator [Mangrovactinospora gilvigrisea]OIV38473.1 transcriptional regulator [Mangrovactinospora gilvigrisea]